MPVPLLPPPAAPKIPTGRELFDALMAHIELELVTENAKKLQEQYKNETPQDHKQRMKHYDLAYERYDQAYKDYMATLDAQVARYRRESFAHTELKDRASDEGLLGQFGNFFQQAAA